MKQFSHSPGRDFTITPTVNGFLISGLYCGTRQQWCFNTFEEAINQLAKMMGIAEIGETLVVEPKTR